MQKSKLQSKQAPICTTIGMKTFSLFQHHSNHFETTLLMKNNIDQWYKYTLMQRYINIWRKMKAKRSTRKKRTLVER
jgi:hypothetical protein